MHSILGLIISYNMIAAALKLRPMKLPGFLGHEASV
jgi:hypothetical protein